MSPFPTECDLMTLIRPRSLSVSDQSIFWGFWQTLTCLAANYYNITAFMFGDRGESKPACFRLSRAVRLMSLAVPSRTFAASSRSKPRPGGYTFDTHTFFMLACKHENMESHFHAGIGAWNQCEYS